MRVCMSNSLTFSFGSTRGGLSAGFSRMLTGQNFFISDYTYQGPDKGYVALGTDFPSKIIRLNVEEYGGKIVCQKGALLCASHTIDIQMEFTKTFTSGFFGGEGFGSTYTSHIDSTFNDLWRYSNGQWTWMSGYGVEGQPGSYGTEGKPAAANVPGSRRSGVTWTDAAGRLWLFGGMGVGSQGKVGYLNDLWVYQP